MKKIFATSGQQSLKQLNGIITGTEPALLCFTIFHSKQFIISLSVNAFSMDFYKTVSWKIEEEKCIEKKNVILIYQIWKRA